jgi:hypothetical protein
MGFSPARIVLHSAALASMTYGYLALHNLIGDTLLKEQFGGRWQFLTIDGYYFLVLSLKIMILQLDDRLALAWLTMALSLANDLVPGVKRKLFSSMSRNAPTVFPALQSLKRVLFIFAAPVSINFSL